MNLRTLFMVVLLGFLIVESHAQDSKKPNVLFIAVDDLNDWVGCLGGHPDVKTPHMDKLAAGGRNFVNAHCVVPVCSPSRVSVMSGLHATTHGSYDLGPSYQSIERLHNVPTIQAHFKANGYRTIAGGKVLHHGFTGPLEDDIDETLPGRRGGPRPKKQMNWPGGAWDWGAYPDTDEQMGDYQIAQNAAAVLRRKHDAPFFLSVGIFRPHVPMFVPQKWFDLYDRERISMPKAPVSDLDDLPPNFKGRLNIEPTHAEVLEKGDWRGMVHAYLACVSFADACVGKVLEGLNEGPNRDNTIVVLWSDHGFHLGEKQRWAKRSLWEESTRTPLIIAGPGIRPGRCNEAVSLLDIYPTLIERCGLTPPSQLDGISLGPQLRNPQTPRERPVLSTSYYENHGIRSKHWRYIRYADGAEELYDHRVDQDEFKNLAQHPEYAEIKRSLAKWLPTNAAAEVKQPGKKKRKR